MRVLLTVAFLPFIGCGPSTPAPDTTTGVPAESIADCRRSCDQQQFFDCYDAAQHAGCFDDCDLADQGQIDRFTSCVGNNTCDSECSLNIQDSSPTNPNPGPGTCIEECNDFLADQCIPGLESSDCVLACQADSAEVIRCLGGRTGCNLPAGCTFEGPVATTPEEICMYECVDLGFFDCITPADAVSCSALCSTVSATQVASFNVCTEAAGICTDDSCYRILNPSGASADVPACQSACDSMGFFGCLDSGAQVACRQGCTVATASAVDDFVACSSGLCNDDSCWLILESTLP